MTGQKVVNLLIANMDITYWSIRLSSRNEANGVDKGIVILSSYKFYFIRVHDNLVQNKKQCLNKNDKILSPVLVDDDYRHQSDFHHHCFYTTT